MGSGASHPYPDEAAALAAGKTQEEIDAYKAGLPKKPKFVYLPVVGRGEQIHLLCAEHGVDYDFVLPAFQPLRLRPWRLMPSMSMLSSPQANSRARMAKARLQRQAYEQY